MKSFNLYREQVDYITNWFKCWTECEQTVALYSLLKRVSDTQAKFLCQVLEQKLKFSPDLDILEEEANDPEYVLNLGHEPVQQALTQLLTHLPLLRVGNLSAKSEYWRMLPQVLDSDGGENEGKELLSYALIHPAVSAAERAWLAQLQHQFLAHVALKLSQKPATGDGGYQWMRDYNNVANMGSGYGAPGVPRCPTFGAVHEASRGETRVWPAMSHTQSPPCPPPVNSYTNVDQICKQHTPLQSASSAPSPYQHSPLEKNVIWNSVPDVPPEISPVHADIPPPMCTWSTPPTHALLQNTLSAPNVKLTPPPSTQINNGSGAPPSVGHQQLRRTLSVTPPGYSHLSGLPPPVQPPVPEHKPVSPQSSAASSSSGSDTHPGEVTQRNSFLERGSGMRDVPTWLRHLRLHKYAHLFQTMSYEEMLDVTEDWLLSQNVTAGASNKIMLSIKRLRGRQNMLKILEKELGEGSAVPVVLEEMKSMLDMPLKEFMPCQPDLDEGVIHSTPPPTTACVDAAVEIAESDVPAQFTWLLLKVTTQLLVGEPNVKSFQICRQLITKCINHEAFTEKQKKTLESRKVALEACHSHMMRFRAYNRQTTGYSGPRTANSPRNYPAGRRGGHNNQNWSPSSGSWPCTKPPPSQTLSVQWSFGSKRAVLGGTTSSHTPLSRCLTNPMAVTSAASTDGKEALSRTQSAPLNSNAPTLSLVKLGSSEISNESDYNAQLESLCISMTEHALGGPGLLSSHRTTSIGLHGTRRSGEHIEKCEHRVETIENHDNAEISLKQMSPPTRLSADHSAQWYC